MQTLTSRRTTVQTVRALCVCCHERPAHFGLADDAGQPVAGGICRECRPAQVDEFQTFWGPVWAEDRRQPASLATVEALAAPLEQLQEQEARAAHRAALVADLREARARLARLRSLQGTDAAYTSPAARARLGAEIAALEVDVDAMDAELFFS